ncbi:MAG: CRTAC1 family protein [Acidobacteriota bacterium]|nr:CRTAC1 family protein [Acidobacteriota bacterium]
MPKNLPARLPASRRQFLQTLAAAGAFGFSNILASAQPASSAPLVPVQFSNVTRKSGIEFVHYKGNDGMSTILEEAGPGVAVADYDGDGFQDIYFVNGRDRYGRGIKTRNALYHNNGDGTFTDVTEKAGVPGTAYGLGCVWGDYDNDGFPDLYVCQYGGNILYHNNGDGTFTDVTAKARVAGLDNGGWFHTGATFFDYDRDGHLDLYAGSYCNFGPHSQRYCDIGNGIMASCLPSAYSGTADTMYRNNGDGTFTEVARKTGIYNPGGKNLSVQAGDYDNDGWPDLFVANDGIPAYLYYNHRNGTFEDTGLASGMAVTGQGGAMAAMCISLGDYDNDGLLDLYVSDFQGSSDHLFHNIGKGMFDDVSYRAGIAAPTLKVLSFGGGFFDCDNDGWLDIFIANGHVYPDISELLPGATYRQINTLFRNNRNGTFTDVTQSSGSGFSTPYAGRGVAFADFDNDGRVEMVVSNNGSEPLLLHNDGPGTNNFINFKLMGRRSNRDAMGARVSLRAGNLSQIREVAGGGSYLSQSDLRLHFGLGSVQEAETVEVAWPSGVKQTFHAVKAGKFYVIEEGNDHLALQKFHPRRA